MPRYLLSDGNSTLVDGVYTFTLDRRLRNATVARVKKVAYIADSGLSVVPNIVYLRSSALHRMASNKHTLILKGNQSENEVDVLAALEETHSAGRFRLMQMPRLAQPRDRLLLYRCRWHEYRDGLGGNLSGGRRRL